MKITKNDKKNYPENIKTKFHLNAKKLKKKKKRTKQKKKEQKEQKEKEKDTI